MIFVIIFFQDMVEYKDIDIQYIQSEDKPAYIMTYNTLEAYFASHMKRVTEVKLWELVYTWRYNVNNNRVAYDVITRDMNKYSRNSLAEVVYSKNRNEWVLITRSRTGK